MKKWLLGISLVLGLQFPAHAGESMDQSTKYLVFGVVGAAGLTASVAASPATSAIVGSGYLASGAVAGTAMAVATQKGGPRASMRPLPIDEEAVVGRRSVAKP